MDELITFGESFYVPPSMIVSGTVTIDGPGARHICVVLRHRPGELIDVVDGEGGRYRVELTECGPGRVTGRVLSSERTAAAQPELLLAVGLIRATRMDLLVEKCSEVGARAVIPLLTSRSLSSKGVSPARLDRWRRIAAGAMAQSARLFLPRILEPTPLRSLAAAVGADAAILLADPRGKSLLSMDIDSLRTKRVVACVGPEGGFTPEEIGHLVSLSAMPVSLGKARLRTETAAAVVLDRLAFLLGL